MRFYKFALWKKYFDLGTGITNYFTKVLVLAGFAAVLGGMKITTTLILGFVYGVFCLFLGWIWVKVGIFEAEQEVSNVYNLFMRQVRRKLKTKSI